MHVQKGKKIVIFISFLNKYQNVIHVSTSIFQWLLVFRSVALVIKKLWAILYFFLHRPDFLPPYTNTMSVGFQLPSF